MHLWTIEHNKYTFNLGQWLIIYTNRTSIAYYIISSVMHAFWLVLAHDLLEDRCIDDVIIKILILYHIKQVDSKFPCVCSVIDHRGRQNVVRTSVTHSAAPHVPLFCSYHILTSSVIYSIPSSNLTIFLILITRIPVTDNIFILKNTLNILSLVQIQTKWKMIFLISLTQA